MLNGLWDRLRGARRIEFFVVLATAALLALALIHSGSGGTLEKTELEVRLERILSRIDGAGSVSAMVNQDADGRASGAVVVSSGLRDVSTYLQLQRAVSTLLELEPDRIEIISASGEFGGMP